MTGLSQEHAQWYVHTWWLAKDSHLHLCFSKAQTRQDIAVLQGTYTVTTQIFPFLSISISGVRNLAPELRIEVCRQHFNTFQGDDLEAAINIRRPTSLSILLTKHLPSAPTSLNGTTADDTSVVFDAIVGEMSHLPINIFQG
jgi:hypothetical protein